MKARLLFKRHGTVQYSPDEYVMESDCKTVVVDLPDISNDNRGNGGIWQLVGYEEIKERRNEHSNT